jgi:hypothetical protein
MTHKINENLSQNCSYIIRIDKNTSESLLKVKVKCSPPAQTRSALQTYICFNITMQIYIKLSSTFCYVNIVSVLLINLSNKHFGSWMHNYAGQDIISHHIAKYTRLNSIQYCVISVHFLKFL